MNWRSPHTCHTRNDHRSWLVPNLCLTEDAGHLLMLLEWKSFNCTLSTMDIIHDCLSLVSHAVPYLGLAFTLFKIIWSSVQQVQVSKQQLEVLAQSVAQLLNALDGAYRARRLLLARTSMPFDDLCRF